MSLHNSYLIALSTLFALVFAIMIHSLIMHRRKLGSSARRFFGPSGTVQWFWAMVPIAILASVDFALIEAPQYRSSAPPKKIELAAVQRPPLAKEPAVSAGQRSAVQ